MTRSAAKSEKIEVRETTELDLRVRRGADFLDEQEPGWAGKIDLETFDLEKGCNCVLGQVVGSFFEALKRYRKLPLPANWSYEYGFVGREEHDDDWRALEADWVTLIRERQGERA